MRMDTLRPGPFHLGLSGYQFHLKLELESRFPSPWSGAPVVTAGWQVLMSSPPSLVNNRQAPSAFSASCSLNSKILSGNRIFSLLPLTSLLDSPNSPGHNRDDFGTHLLPTSKEVGRVRRKLSCDIYVTYKLPSVEGLLCAVTDHCTSIKPHAWPAPGEREEVVFPLHLHLSFHQSLPSCRVAFLPVWAPLFGSAARTAFLLDKCPTLQNLIFFHCAANS